MHFRPILVALVMAILVLAVACSPEDEDGTGSTRSPEARGTTTTVAESPQTPAETRTATVPNVSRDGYPGTFAYTVKPGDTLFSIATRFGTTVAELQRLNDVPVPEDLEVGAILFVPIATPTPTPSPTPRPTATPVPAGPSQLVEHGPRSSGKVALTFDMGGRVEPALDIMNWLIDRNVRATIFITGSIVENANHDDGRQVLALIEAHPDLFELGNHSYSHPRFTELTAAQMTDELRRTETAVAKYSSLTMRPLFRPPEGARNASVLSAVGSAGYAYTIMWDVDTIDWRPVSEGGPTASQIVAKVTNNAQGGSIVLMHLGGYNTLDALPGILSWMQSQGLQPAKVSEFLP